LKIDAQGFECRIMDAMSFDERKTTSLGSNL
jgi:hypothetical protein